MDHSMDNHSACRSWNAGFPHPNRTLEIVTNHKHHGQPLLYAVASGGKDDGGRHDKKWGEGDTGGDFVFRPHQGG